MPASTLKIEHARFVVTVDPERRIIEDGSILIEDRRITQVGKAAELARATGLGGRMRSFADASERARTAVRKAITRAIREIAAANPAVIPRLPRVPRSAVVVRALTPWAT